MEQRVIFHVDANSAFLSWSAAYRVNVLKEEVDLREVPAVVAGDKASRHSIILAKSGPAKKFGIQTGEPLFQAQEKCPDLIVIPPDSMWILEDDTGLGGASDTIWFSSRTDSRIFRRWK